MTSSELITTADSFPVTITTPPCLGPYQVVSGFALIAWYAYATMGSHVRHTITIEFDATQPAGEELCVALAGGPVAGCRCWVDVAATPGTVAASSEAPTGVAGKWMAPGGTP